MPRPKNVRKSTSISIRGDLTLDTVVQVHTQMLEAVSASELIVDITEMGRIDLAGLQLLYALEHTVVSAGGTIQLQGDDALARLSRMISFTGLRTPSFLEGGDE